MTELEKYKLCFAISISEMDSGDKYDMFEAILKDKEIDRRKFCEHTLEIFDAKLQALKNQGE